MFWLNYYIESLTCIQIVCYYSLLLRKTQISQAMIDNLTPIKFYVNFDCMCFVEITNSVWWL